jgi:hypothetical protein
MDDHDILQKAIEEIRSQTFGLTQQFLAIHEVDLSGFDRWRIDRENTDGTVVVYCPVKQEKFTFAINFDTIPELRVRWVGTVPYASVCFRASSETLDFRDLAALSVLPHTGGWNKGDRRKYGNSTYTFSSIWMEPNPEPGEFEHKLSKLLFFLGQDEAGVKRMVEKAGGYIQVAMEFHNGNTMLGGAHISLDLIKKMSQLNLAIDFDLYVGGNLFKPTE